MIISICLWIHRAYISYQEDKNFKLFHFITTVLSDPDEANNLGVHFSKKESQSIYYRIDLLSNLWKTCHYYIERIQLLLHRIPVLLFSLPQYLFVNSIQYVEGMDTVEYENYMLKFCFSIYYIL